MHFIAFCELRIDYRLIVISHSEPDWNQTGIPRHCSNYSLVFRAALFTFSSCVSSVSIRSNMITRGILFIPDVYLIRHIEYILFRSDILCQLDLWYDCNVILSIEYDKCHLIIAPSWSSHPDSHSYLVWKSSWSSGQFPSRPPCRSPGRPGPGWGG